MEKIQKVIYKCFEEEKLLDSKLIITITLTTPENKPDVTNHKFYWATQAFSKDDLPVGTIIKIASNWQYRPDAWNQDNYENHTSSTRPANVTTNQIVIDEAWWGNYTHRGFNIAIKGSAIDITGLTEDQINSVFQIYVPVEVSEEDKEDPTEEPKEEEKDEIERVALELTKASFYNSQPHTKALTYKHSSKESTAIRYTTHCAKEQKEQVTCVHSLSQQKTFG